MLDRESVELLREALEKLDAGFVTLPENPARPPASERMADVLNAAADRLQNNYPYFHPLYAGQMLKPPHPVARIAYALAQWINPNNHALDGGRASSAMEKEAIVELARTGALYAQADQRGFATAVRNHSLRLTRKNGCECSSEKVDAR